MYKSNIYTTRLIQHSLARRKKMTNKELKRQTFLKAARDYKESRIQMVLKRTDAYTREQLEKMDDNKIGYIIAANSVEE